MPNNNPVCITRCPAFTAIRTIASSRWGVAEEISFQIYKEKRQKETRLNKPIIKSWTSYPSSGYRSAPLSAEEVDGTIVLCEQ